MRRRLPVILAFLALAAGRASGGGDSESWKSRDLAAARAGEWAKLSNLWIPDLNK